MLSAGRGVGPAGRRLPTRDEGVYRLEGRGKHARLWFPPGRPLTTLIIVHTLNRPAISYDPVKNAKNLARGRPSFDEVAGFDFDTAQMAVDERKSYGEVRYVAYGLCGQRVHALVFTRTPDDIRVISFRKANKREVRQYENAK